MSGVPGTVPGIMRREQETPVRLGLIAGDRFEVSYLLHFRLSCYAQSGSDWDEHHVLVAWAAFEGGALVAERPITERVRQMVAEAFASLGVLKPEQFRESILMRAGHYCGRRFEAQGAHAVWFVEEN